MKLSQYYSHGQEQSHITVQTLKQLSPVSQIKSTHLSFLTDPVWILI